MLKQNLNSRGMQILLFEHNCVGKKILVRNKKEIYLHI